MVKMVKMNMHFNEDNYFPTIFSEEHGCNFPFSHLFTPGPKEDA